MRTTRLSNEKIISQKVIDINKKISVRYFKNEENNKVGFQFVKLNYDEVVDPFTHSKLDWFYGYFKCLSEAEEHAFDLYSQFNLDI